MINIRKYYPKRHRHGEIKKKNKSWIPKRFIDSPAYFQNIYKKNNPGNSYWDFFTNSCKYIWYHIFTPLFKLIYGIVSGMLSIIILPLFIYLFFSISPDGLFIEEVGFWLHDSLITSNVDFLDTLESEEPFTRPTVHTAYGVWSLFDHEINFFFSSDAAYRALNTDLFYFDDDNGVIAIYPSAILENDLSLHPLFTLHDIGLSDIDHIYKNRFFDDILAMLTSYEDEFEDNQTREEEEDEASQAHIDFILGGLFTNCFLANREMMIDRTDFLIINDFPSEPYLTDPTYYMEYDFSRLMRQLAFEEMINSRGFVAELLLIPDINTIFLKKFLICIVFRRRGRLFLFS